MRHFRLSANTGSAEDMATDRVATIVLACLEIWRLVLVARLVQVRRRWSIPDQPTAPRHDAPQE